MMLLELGFINEKQNEDIEMAAELFSHIQPEKQDDQPSIKPKNLLTILTAVLNFELSWMLTSSSSKDHVGTFSDEGDYKLTPKEI